MKSVLVFLLIAVATCVHAQDSIVRYWMYNRATGTYDIATTDPSKAQTRAVYYFKGGLWKMESRYLSNGNLYMRAGYKTPEGRNEGDYETFYDNGKREIKSHYTDGLLNGLYLTWYLDGSRKDSLFMKDGSIVGKGNRLDRNGKPELIYDLDEEGNGQVKYLNEDQSVASEGSFVNSKRDGKWTFYANEGYREWEVMYQKDSVASAVCFNKEGVQQKDCIFEREALPAGGLSGWATYLQKAIPPYNYPSRKLYRSKAKLSGSVLVRFLIEKDGSVSDVEITQSLNPEADAIAKAVIAKAPRWTPGIYRGKVVRSYHTQPVTFVVQ